MSATSTPQGCPLDVRVVATGLVPVELARRAPLGGPHGFPVRATLRHRDHDDVYAAGDIASYPDPILGRTRVEHVDNATTMGAAAGRIMAGSDEAYDHTPMFYSDVLGLGYQAVGTLDATLETFVERVGEGAVAYYLDDEAVRGVLLWDLDEGVEEAKQLLARHSRPRDPADLAGSITG